MRFLLKVGAGMHIQGDKIYRAGEVVESKVRLDRLLKNKFVYLDSDTPKTVTRKKIARSDRKPKGVRKRTRKP